MGGIVVKTVVKYIRLPKELVEQVECFMRQEGYRSFVETVAELIRRGLAASRIYGFDPDRCRG